MLGSVLRIAAAAFLALGLAFAPMASDAAPAKSKSKSAASSKVKGKKDKKSSKKDRKSKSDKKAVNGKKGKNDRKSKSDRKSRKDSKSKVSKTAKRDSRSAGSRSGRDDNREARSTRASSNTYSSKQSEPVAAGHSGSVEPNYVSTGGDGSDSFDEPVLPKPANRVVADIASGRVVEIQNALIKQGLLAGPANGVYDQPTFAAMQAFQSRNGWNPVGVPTADSLKKLGVPKNSGRAYPSPSRVVEETATDRP